MIGEPSATSTLSPPQAKASVLITISTPGADTPICRLGSSEDVVKGLTVRQLIQRIVSPNSLFSVGVPINQLQAESTTALAIGELMKADCCEVMVPGKGASPHRSVSLDDLVHDVAREQVGTQGNRFLNINLDVRSTADSSAPRGDERRHSFTPQTLEVEGKKPLLTGGMVNVPRRSEPAPKPAEAPDEAPEKSKPTSLFGSDSPSASPIREAAPEPVSEAKPFADSAAPEADSKPLSDALAPDTDAVSEPKGVISGDLAEEKPLEMASPVEVSAKPAEKPLDEPVSEPAKADVEPASVDVKPASVEGKDEAETGESAKPAAPGKIVTIMAEKLKEEPKKQLPDRKEYVRKSDWLRAQFLPEVEALDFSGLFVGNLGLGIREEKARRSVVLADPARITEVLLRANGYRRSGDHPKALICYQELVDMDASNSDFRFLLGKTLMELGQREQAVDAFTRAKELGHDGAAKELDDLKRSGHRPKAALGFLRFWKQ